MPLLPATVNGIGPFQFLLDTGGAGGHLDGEIAKRLGLKLERGIASVSGSANLEVGVIPEAMLAVGAARHRGLLLVSPLAPNEPILGRPFEGILGSDFLQRYVLELNYDAHVLRLYEPADFRYTGRGQARPSFSPAYVHSVRDRSPAKEAGIQPGDVLVRIDDRPTSGLTLDEMRELLKTPGRTHRLAVSRQGKPVGVTLETRDLL